jgi:hypothetical protein
LVQVVLVERVHPVLEQQVGKHYLVLIAPLMVAQPV